MANQDAKTILIADDEQSIRDLFKIVLEPDGYIVIQTDNGREALEILQKSGADLLIIDLVMPEQEGIETISAARKKFPQLKILAISGYAHGSYLTIAKAMGADEVLGKPISPDLLSKTVKSLVGG